MTSDNSVQKIQPRSAVERIVDSIFVNSAKIFAFSIAGILLWITLIVAFKSQPAIAKYGLSFFTASNWNPVKDDYGILPAIYGTIASSAIALAISVPIGLGVATFLSEDYLPRKIQRIFVFLIELLAAVPSVVYGLWGLFILIPFLKKVAPLNGPSLLPAALILAVMVLPTIAVISRDAIVSVPPDLRQAAVGVGATRWEAILQIILPAASSGIVGGIMLALGRALGETMAVTMLIGNSNDIKFSVFAPSNTIASLLASQFAEAKDMQIASLMYAALILFALTLLVNVFAQLLVKQLQKI